MKKRVPLVLTIIFLSAFIIFSGIFIYINCSPIKFKDIYGSRSELGDVDLVFYKDRDIFGEKSLLELKQLVEEMLLMRGVLMVLTYLKIRSF